MPIYPPPSSFPPSEKDFSDPRSMEGNLNPQNSAAVNVAVLGATGSIGSGALDVIAASGGLLCPYLLSAHSQTAKLAELARRFRPAVLVVTDKDADPTPLSEFSSDIEILWGEDALEEAVRRQEIETVLSAIVGSAGLRGTWSAVDAGKIVALANKESLVLAGGLLMNLAQKTGAIILPVDSEHSAVWQSLAARFLACVPYEDAAAGKNPNLREYPQRFPQITGKDLVRRLILTASGGPFRNRSLAELENVTVDDALAHPTWKMGKKITIDSATMMNKAFEIIEARWLFDLVPPQIAVMIHPQSIIHSLVEFIDGAVIAQMGPPDMRLPIQLALYGMTRHKGPTTPMDWSQTYSLEMIPPDLERFPALRLGFQAASDGGTSGAVINAANEIAVDAFLRGKIPFKKITDACRAILENHQFEKEPTLSRLFEMDRWARRETKKWISE